jgi:hypothetical protein
MVGQQTYAQQMQGLNEVGMDLYDRAYQQYMNEGDQLAQQYSMLADREGELYNRDYQVGRDAVADNQWQTSLDYQKERDKADDEYRDATLKQDQDQFDALYGEEGYYNAQADKEYERMYGDLKYDENGNIIGGGYYTQQNAADNKYRDEALKQEQDQFDALYGEEGYYNKQADTEYERMYGEEGYYTKKDKQEQDQFDALYGEEGYYTKKDKQEQDNYENEFEYQQKQFNYLNGTEFDENGNLVATEESKEANNPNTTYEGESALNGQSVPKALAGVQGLTTTNTNLFDSNGNFKSAAVVSVERANEDPNDDTPNAYDVVTYNVGGKEVKLRRGYSPYTNSKNPDAANGTFNGFQPDNVGGNKLSDTGVETIVNGQWVPIYSTPDGKEWVYDAANNKYFEAEKEEENKPKNAGGFSGGGGGGSKVVQTQK